MRTLLVFFLFIFLTGCGTTARYGNKIEPSPSNPDQYVFTVYAVGSPLPSKIDKRANEIAQEYVEENGLTSYKIITSTCVTSPSSQCLYTVEFE